MRFVTFEDVKGQRVGLHQPDNGVVIDLSRAAPRLPTDMLSLIALGSDNIAAACNGQSGADVSLPDSEIRILAPIPLPARNIFCVGKNYHDHIDEVRASSFVKSKTDVDVPDYPVLFTKAPSCVIGPGDTIPAHLDDTDSTDYEGELAVIIGKGGRGIADKDVWNHIFGYTVLNDVTARTIQIRHGQWFLGKSIDGFCPLGPAIVTPDEIPDVQSLRLRTLVNGDVRQDTVVSNMIFDIPTIITTLSRTIHLNPGDVIATGTPSGVAMGFNPPKFLKKGDIVSVRIDGVGELTNVVG
jgi:2-keto-4-pentenoate hydratase/2-oxohepta-3-ene-1,7-dioic acid hydratase in catechol pathway